jgi:allophanate hydrolase subunit 2
MSMAQIEGGMYVILFSFFKWQRHKYKIKDNSDRFALRLAGAERSSYFH